MPEQNGNSQPVLVVKSYQVVLAFLTTIALIALSYGSNQAKTEQNRVDIQDLRSNTLTRSEFQEMKDDTHQRLDRIEKKIDQERAFQDLTDMQRENARRRMH